MELTLEIISDAQKRAAEILGKNNIVITEKEKSNIEICDYELGMFETIGTEIVIYVNTDRVCAKELVLFPWQICPEHRHPVLGNYPGKEETFRCRQGEVYLYVEGEAGKNPKARIPDDKRDVFTVWNEIILKPGEQYTLEPNTLHWFQAGPEGCIVSEFSTQSYDMEDIFTDPAITRTTNIK